jgi:hypothetical protein
MEEGVKEEAFICCGLANMMGRVERKVPISVMYSDP